MIEFTVAEKEQMAQKLKHYFDQELDLEIGQFDAEFLLEYFSKEIGVYHYNRGLSDARDMLMTKMDGLTDALYELEMPTEFSKR